MVAKPTSVDVVQDHRAAAMHLLRICQAAWYKRSDIDDRALFLTAPGLQSDDGEPVGPIVHLDLKDLPANRHLEDIADAFARLSPHVQAIIWVRREDDGFSVLLETAKETRLLRTRKSRHGDLDVLSAPEVTVNQEGLGLLRKTGS